MANSKPLIGVDVDGTLNDFASSFARLSNEHFGTSLVRDDFSEDLMSVWQVDADEMRRRLDLLNRGSIWSEAAKSREDAAPALRQLKKDYDLVVITSRPRSLLGHTTKMINECFPDIFSDIIAPGLWDNLDGGVHRLTKADICQEVGVSYLIDDQAKHCNATAEVGIKALLFGDEPWNRDEAIIDGVTRVSDWPAVLNYFKTEQD